MNATNGWKDDDTVGICLEFFPLDGNDNLVSKRCQKGEKKSNERKINRYIKL